MTKLKLLSAALIATATLATPAMARTSHVTSRHRARGANASASPTARYIDGRVHISAPRVGAFPPARPECDPDSQRPQQFDGDFCRPADHHLTTGINSMNLEDGLGDVETDCRDRLHG